MILEFDAVTARVVHSTPEELDWLSGYLCFPNPKAHFNGGPREVSAFTQHTRTFPAGFVPMVTKAASENTPPFTVQKIDKRPDPVLLPDPDLAWLRDYQREAFDTAMTATRGILWMPTGSGKTEILIALTRAVQGPWLFIVHRMTLAVQAADRWALRNGGARPGEVGLIGEGKRSIGSVLTCATFQSLRAALRACDQDILNLLRGVSGVVVDEAHVLPADSFLGVISRCRGYYRIGLSATPLARGDRRSVFAIGQLGPVIYRLRMERLAAEGVVARGAVRMVQLIQPEAPQHRWSDVYEMRVTKSDMRNRLVVECAARATKPAMVFVTHREHGERISALLWKRGIKNDFVHGKHSTDYRKSAIRSLERGAIDVIVASEIFTAGVDVPSLRGIVNAAGGETVIGTVQKAGRGSRPDRDPNGKLRDGGDVFEIYDFNDVGTPWLEKHSRSRKKAYLAEGYTLTEETPIMAAVAR